MSKVWIFENNQIRRAILKFQTNMTHDSDTKVIYMNDAISNAVSKISCQHHIFRSWLLWIHYGFYSSSLAQDLFSEIGLSVSVQAHEVNLHGWHPRREPSLTNRQKTAGIKVCQRKWKEAWWLSTTRSLVRWSYDKPLAGSDGLQHIWHGPWLDYYNDCMVPNLKHKEGRVW